MPQQLTDQEIITTIQSGDRVAINNALKVIYIANYESVKSLVFKSKGNAEDAADVFQQAIMVLYDHIRKGKFLGKSKLSTYLYAISRNIWYKTLKQENKTFDLSLFDIHMSTIATDEIENLVIVYEKKLTLSDLLEQLGESCKDILSDFYYSGMSLKEIAEKFDLANEATAKNKKYRCMVKLMQLVSDLNIEMQDVFIEDK